MALLQLLRLLIFIIFLVFISQISAQINRSYSRRRTFWRQDIQPCPNTSTCIPWNRCPPSRRSSWEESQKCSYEKYSRWNPGLCCLNQRRPRPRLPVLANSTQAPRHSTERQTLDTTVPPETNCGISQSFSIWVIGGSLAAQGDWPWMVSFTRPDSQGKQHPFCSGALLDRRHVLSAAHCFKNNNPSIYKARIGNVNQDLSDVYGIKRIDIPEGYVEGMFYNDVAVITLTREVNTTDFMPICLPRPNTRNLTGIVTTFAGWGSMRLKGSNVNKLQQLHGMPVISNYQCNELFKNISSFKNVFPEGITDSIICAGFLGGGKDICRGDSGGPLMFREGGRYYVIGIASYGYSCALPNVPGGYTRVSSFIDFIRMNSEKDV